MTFKCGCKISDKEIKEKKEKEKKAYARRFMEMLLMKDVVKEEE